ncbi:hypothetical protein [Bacillus sp. Marseille-P3661]|uniref:hypothetical protein n=1 Tax=Bacillus sp. Marseille-P3661 TaxID=1936234 RepID=UPI000C83DA34|nr:hypothetical protein [Bacillus sp. Marseille-P3661]
MGKRKLITVLLTVGLAFGAVSTSVLANELPTKEEMYKLFENGVPSFSEMLPFMKNMHPTWSEDQLEDMYKACHEEGGMMQNSRFAPQQQSNMMNNF